MTQEEIQERNKQIIQMLGFKRGFWIHQEKPLTDDKKQWWDIDGKTFLGTRVRYDKDLEFHSNWNWLMEAVKFIEKLDGSYSISNKSCAISVDEPYWFGAEIIVKTNESIHEAVFIAVSDFAKLYNEGEL